jgi:ADP-ribose pyrophosphatase
MVADPAPGAWPVSGTEEHYSNWLVTVRSDQVVLPDGEQVSRTVVRHIGAVAVLALDDQQRVLMIRQYRHPAGRELWEIPAGLRDVDGEALVDTARRELLEETGYAARTWHSLVDFYASPGIGTERVRIFLVRDLAAEQTSYERHGEEKFLQHAWVPLAEAVDAVLAGRLHNGATIQGVLAAAAASARGFAGLRAPDVPEE